MDAREQPHFLFGAVQGFLPRHLGVGAGPIVVRVAAWWSVCSSLRFCFHLPSKWLALQAAARARTKLRAHVRRNVRLSTVSLVDA